jgi:benzoyl-CoA reductase/2-hydroxyglutaryl-CoA dehydratase subunit BcrC/BadD/HgdB
MESMARTDQYRRFCGMAIASQSNPARFKDQERVMKATAVDGEVLTAKEVCAVLQIHPSTLYKLIKQDGIPIFESATTGFRTGLIERRMAEKSVFARLARNFVESGVN